MKKESRSQEVGFKMENRDFLSSYQFSLLHSLFQILSSVF
jgi:hypothetical protein